MIFEIIQSLFFLFLPLLIIKLTNKFKPLNMLGPVVLCYIVGILLANNPFIQIDKSLSSNIFEIAVPLALPLILFQTDIKGWLKSSRSTVTSFFLVIISAFLASVIASLVFSSTVDEYWKIGGMLVGCYTGGTPNLMAIGLGLNVNSNTIVLVNAADTAVGGLYFLFTITFSKRIFSKYLPEYKSTSEKYEGTIPNPANEKYTYSIKGMAVALFISIMIASAGIGLSFILTGQLIIWIIILVISTFAIIMSLFPQIRGIKGTYEFGQYILLIFSFAIGATINIKDFFSSSTGIFPFVFLVVFLAVVIHFILCVIFKIDVDTMIITSIAGIFGPVFIGPVANSLKNKEIIIAGITSGLIGYAVGNYLGFITAMFIKLII